MKNPKGKPEHFTSLSGDNLVSKTHARIVFRGALDLLEAEIMEAQIPAFNAGEQWYCDCLGEVLTLLRQVMKTEVLNVPLPQICLFGLSEEELHQQSHNVKQDFGLAALPLPDYSLGPLAVRLNYLRARIREVEILAVRAFTETGDMSSERNSETLNEQELFYGNDIVKTMNRLSSALWWLFCKYAADRINSIR